MGTFVGTSANGGNVTALTTANSAAITWPTVQAGDLAILAWTFQNTATPTDPTSQAFTLWDQIDDGSCRSRLLYRICTGSESGTISGWLNSIQNRQTAVLFVVRGYSGIAGATSATEPGTSTTHDCPSIGTGNGAATGDSVIVIGADRSGATTTATPPSGWSKRTTSEFGLAASGGTYTGIADDGLSTGQTFPVDPGVWTMASGSTSVTRTLALRPSVLTGTVAVTQAANASTATGQLGYTGAATPTQAANTSAGSGAVTGPVAGTVAAPQASNTANATGSLGYAGTAAITQAAEASTASGQLGYSGTSARSQTNQTAAATGGLGYTATGSPAQAANTASAVGAVINPVVGAVAASQATQGAAASGVLGYVATVFVVQASDMGSAAGVYFVPITGSVAATQAGQTSEAAGAFLPRITPRPDLGTTARTANGVTPRPFTTVTPRP